MTKDMLSGVIALVVGGIYLATAFLLPNYKLGDQVGPKLFPQIIGVVSILAGALLIVGDLRKGKKSAKAEFGFVKDKAVWIKIGLITVGGFAYGLLLDPLGFTVATVLFMGFITTLINKGKAVQNLIISLVFPILTYGIFSLALRLSLPRGLIENLLPF